MKVRNLHGELVAWNPKPSQFGLKPKEISKSTKQFDAGQVLKKKFPLDVILEDVTLPNSRLSLDFFLPQRKIAIEIQGSQHHEYTPHYHKTRLALAHQIERDDSKRRFCAQNNIRLIVANDAEELLCLL